MSTLDQEQFDQVDTLIAKLSNEARKSGDAAAQREARLTAIAIAAVATEVA